MNEVMVIPPAALAFLRGLASPQPINRITLGRPPKARRKRKARVKLANALDSYRTRYTHVLSPSYRYKGPGTVIGRKA